MKNESKYKIRLGLFASLCVFLFLLAIYLIGSKQNLFGKTFHISGLFKNVNGLQSGNNVRFFGINVGTVQSITIISDSTVKVDMVIEKNAERFIKKNATAMIGSEGLMGNKIVNILPGTAGNETIKENDTIQTIKPTDIDEIFKSLKVTEQNAELITGHLADLVAKINEGHGVIGTFLKDTVIIQDFKQTVTNAKDVSTNLQHLISKMDSGVMELLVTINNINHGKGTLNTLLIDSALSRNLEQTVLNLKQGSSRFNESMEALKHSFLLRKYFKNLEKGDSIIKTSSPDKNQ